MKDSGLRLSAGFRTFFQPRGETFGYKASFFAQGRRRIDNFFEQKPEGGLPENSVAADLHGADGIDTTGLREIFAPIQNGAWEGVINASNLLTDTPMGG